MGSERGVQVPSYIYILIILQWNYLFFESSIPILLRAQLVYENEFRGLHTQSPSLFRDTGRGMLRTSIPPQ